MRFIWERGKHRRRVRHLARYTQTGEMLFEALCGQRLAFDTSSNVPFGVRVCKRCRKAAAS